MANKEDYAIDVINCADFLDGLTIELVEFSVQDYPFKYIVIIRDEKAHRVEFFRDMINFRVARAFFTYLLENEMSVRTIGDLYTLFQDFTSKRDDVRG